MAAAGVIDDNGLVLVRCPDAEMNEEDRKKSADNGRKKRPRRR